MGNELSLRDIEFGVQPIEIKNLVVSPAPLMRLNIGSTDSFARVLTNPAIVGQVNGIVWNEEKITLVTNDRSSYIQFRPEIEPETRMFMCRSDRRRGDREGNEWMVWSGDFQPVQFNKADLIKFLKIHAMDSDLPVDIIDKIKNMKVTERKEEKSSISLNDAGDESGTVTTIDESMTANIPAMFSLKLKVTEGYIGFFKFSAKVVKEKNDYDRETGRKKIELTCLNAREILQDMMKQTLSLAPKEIPVYYGTLGIKESSN